MVFARGPSVRSHDVGVDDSNGRHEGKHRGGADETEAPRFQVRGQGDGLGGLGGNVARAGGARIRAAPIGPHQLAQVRGAGGRRTRALGDAQLDGGPGVGDRGLDFSAVANNRWVGRQTFDVRVGEGGDRVW